MPGQLDEKSRNVIVLGASAGGAQALIALFQQIPADLVAAFLVVLHIPAHEPSKLHDILSNATKMRVTVAREGDQLQPGCVYVAISDRHLMFKQQEIRLTRGAKGVSGKAFRGCMIPICSRAFRRSRDWCDWCDWCDSLGRAG